MIILLYIILLFIIIIILINYFIKLNYVESFIPYKKITTWTPYVMDCYNQPCYSNYFYGNGYMYPIY